MSLWYCFYYCIITLPKVDGAVFLAQFVYLSVCPYQSHSTKNFSMYVCKYVCIQAHKIANLMKYSTHGYDKLLCENHLDPDADPYSIFF